MLSNNLMHDNVDGRKSSQSHSNNRSIEDAVVQML